MNSIRCRYYRIIIWCDSISTSPSKKRDSLSRVIAVPSSAKARAFSTWLSCHWYLHASQIVYPVYIVETRLSRLRSITNVSASTGGASPAPRHTAKYSTNVAKTRLSHLQFHNERLAHNRAASPPPTTRRQIVDLRHVRYYGAGRTPRGRQRP